MDRCECQSKEDVEKDGKLVCMNCGGVISENLNASSAEGGSSE